MLLLNSQDVAISAAKVAGTLRLSPFETRFGTTAWALNDEAGLIEVFDTALDAVKRCFGEHHKQGGIGIFRRLLCQAKGRK